MKYTLSSTIVSASLVLTSSAFAGTECGYKSTARPMTATFLQTDRTAEYGGFVKAAHHGDNANPNETRGPDIVETAMAAGSFDTLVSAVKAAGLVDTLKGEGPFTVFAPTDAAFAKLPAGTLEALLNDTDKLKRILTYHVVAGRLDSAAVTGSETLATVEGGQVAVRDIAISQTDIETSNGIIHVIDEVLIPAS